jgi:hypothetical protein
MERVAPVDVTPKNHFRRCSFLTNTRDRDTKDRAIPIRWLFRFIREFSTRQYFLGTHVPIPIDGAVNTGSALASILAT